jgi:uncharacterized protein YrrD
MQGKDATELVSMPIIATAEGREVGRIRDVLFDPEAKSLLGLLVNSTAGSTDVPMFLQRRDISSVGKDAVTVRDAAVLQPYAMHQEAQRVVDSGIHLRGSNVLTEGGESLGKVDKVMIDEDGSIAGYTTSSGILGFGDHREIRGDQVRRIGADALIVSDDAAEREPQPSDQTPPAI